MDQTPPPGRKPKDVPFYKTPENVRTSSQIIKEAKNSLQRPQLRPLSTRRPETPQDGQRKLFGEQSIRDPTSRPASAFSLGSRHFDPESRPVSGTRLSPLDHKPRVTEEGGNIAPKPPADPNRQLRRTGSRQRIIQQQISVESSSDGSTVDRLTRSKSGSLTDVTVTSPTSSKPGTPEVQRRVRSGPKERTSGERTSGEPDSGTPPRSDSGKRRRSRDRREVENGYQGDARDATQREGSAGSLRVSSAGKAGSAGRREEETPEEAYLYNTKIGPIMDEMQRHIKEKDPERLSELGAELYQALDDANMLGKTCKRRSLILKTIFKLLDLESPKLLLRLARLILALRVSGNNLVNVCKLVFKVSRDDKNDTFFLEGNVLDLLIDTVRGPDIMGSSEALVYCVGALKFLSSNHTVVKHLVKRNSLDALAKLLVSVNKTTSEAGRPTEQTGHILVQLTAAIRNLSEVGGTRAQILSLNIIEELCKVLENHQADGDLMMNLARIFSKLTQHQDCCVVLSSQPSLYKSFLHILHKFHRREDLVVRVSYILGNLTLRSDESRHQLFDQPKALDTLLHVFKYYCQQDLKMAPGERTDSKTSTKIEDVLIKVIRVIANLSINEEIGPILAGSRPCVDLLIQIMDRKSLDDNEELVLNSMATINNLSYYNTKDSAITHKQMALAECLMKYLDHNHMEGMSEATRVYGNLSREKEIRDFLVKKKVDEFMVVLLDSGDREVVFTSVGVLINLMADDEKRSTLMQQGGVRKLIDVLRDFAREDWNLAAMVCKTLWNYSGRITSTNACFGDAEGTELAEILDEYLDEESAMDNTLGDLYELYHTVWASEFCPVATQLLHRIEANQSDFEPLEHPS